MWAASHFVPGISPAKLAEKYPGEFELPPYFLRVQISVIRLASAVFLSRTNRPIYLLLWDLGDEEKE